MGLKKPWRLEEDPEYEPIQFAEGSGSQEPMGVINAKRSGDASGATSAATI